MNKILIPLAATTMLWGCGPAPSAPKAIPLIKSAARTPAPATVATAGVTGVAVAPSQPHSGLMPPPNPLPPSLPSSVVTPGALPGTLATLVRLGKVEVEKTFATSAPGITGYLVKQSGQYTVLYGSGSYLLAGALIGPDGRNLTSDYKEQYAPKPDYASLVQQIDADATVFTLGTKGPLLYAFEDPNCIFCHKLDQAKAPLIAAGKLRVKIVMVSFLKADSAARAAAILTAKSPATAMAENEAKYDAAREEGGYPVGPQPRPDLMDTLKRHLDWMQQTGSSGTPTLIYRTADGKWTARSGDPGVAWLAQYASAGHG